ncbi:MAG TPA: hypothetical protein P5279_14850 [Anaerohalosphaeraceae bacterium]|jgi:hypothetical protein|nr:hypothetical protein [Anaerohalosphaeraceae bacterium]HRT51765.1 hypothetical protein [Anaerohalosphaeraceae bacterium]HRT87740.1 hypothetical protein [Anaerohalosphaeraceae bacterium]
MSRARLIFIIFFLTAVLIGTVHLRVSASRVFFRCRKAIVEQDNLRLQLGRKQLALEELLNPSIISEHIKKGADAPHEERPAGR